MKQPPEHEDIDFDLPGDDAVTNELLKSDPEFRRDFAEHWLLVAALDETLGEDAGENRISSVQSAKKSPSDARSWAPFLHYGGWAVAALLMVFVLAGLGKNSDSSPLSRAQFSGLVQANFFGELTPPINSHPELNRNYSLVSGSVELAFPDGATTIIEGPAVFRVVSDDRLALDTGQCSVHAPKGAEGFRVDTPTSRVVDRGTRFHVSVSEMSETEVQVLEGAADIYPIDNDAGKVHLTNGSARRIGNRGLVPVDFSSKSYRKQVPDRIISFDATNGPDDRARTLRSVTVQRDGLVRKYDAQELIAIELVAFNPGGSSPNLHVFGDAILPDRKTALIEDLLLNGGIINPGGSVSPIQSDFDYRTVPGFGIRFVRPVRNGPGPDVVFFEVQNPMNPPEGDAFHVGPLVWEQGRQTHTIHRYDLMMTSAESLPITKRYIHNSEEPINSAEDLETAQYSAELSPLNTKALAVGIDLSDLGYAEGEAATGLFFQDANDDNNHVDPIVIRGLPN